MRQEQYLTARQVARIYPFYTRESLKTLRYRKKSPFPYYKIEGKVFYKRSEIESIINSGKVLNRNEKKTDLRILW